MKIDILTIPAALLALSLVSCENPADKPDKGKGPTAKARKLGLVVTGKRLDHPAEDGRGRAGYSRCTGRDYPGQDRLIPALEYLPAKAQFALAGRAPLARAIMAQRDVGPHRVTPVQVRVRRMPRVIRRV